MSKTPAKKFSKEFGKLKAELEEKMKRLCLFESYVQEFDESNVELLDLIESLQHETSYLISTNIKIIYYLETFFKTGEIPAEKLLELIDETKKFYLSYTDSFIYLEKEMRIFLEEEVYDSLSKNLK